MTQPKDKHAFNIASEVLRAAGSSFHHYTPYNQEHIMQACEKALQEAMQARHEDTWAMACNQVADKIADVFECLAELGVPISASSIRALPCPPLPTESE